MRMILKALSGICLMACLVSVSQAKEWRGIVPLHSTRADVERLLGRASNECKCSYYSDDVNVFVVYSSGNCKSGESGGWNIPPDTVIRFSIHPKVLPKLSELKVDLSTFEKADDPELVGNTIYMNKAEGFGFYVDVSGVVMDFYYEPAAKDENLHCPDTAPNNGMHRTRN